MMQTDISVLSTVPTQGRQDLTATRGRGRPLSVTQRRADIRESPLTGAGAGSTDSAVTV